MRNRMATLMSGALVLAISTWIPARAEDEPVRAHYFGNSLTDQLKYDYFKNLCTEAGHPLQWKREMAPGVPVVGIAVRDSGLCATPAAPRDDCL